jgi:type I restriction enzyme S subunit
MLSGLVSPFVLNAKVYISINENLLQQAQALYKDRIIDMQPFDGEMPDNWHLGTVSEIVELHDSKRIPLSSRERADLAKIYPYYGATSVMDYVDRYLFDGIYLLLGEDGTVVDSKGFPILQYVEGKFWVNNHAHIITGKNGFSVELLYLLFSLTSVQSIVTGAVQPKISQANLNKVPVIVPSDDELKAFDATVQPVFAQIRNLRAENDRLATTRDTLLPRLMSGELDVSTLDL